VNVDLYAGELGYYKFEECPDEGVNPTIGMITDETYTFIQKDKSNYYHPLGFAYFADGAHDGKDELEPSIRPPGSSSSCADTNVCPAPQYFVNGDYVGIYDNGVSGPTVIGDENFGLDAYEPQFFYPIAQWTEKDYTVKLKFNIDDGDSDFFYFCHIHQGMTGRVKLLDSDGDEILSENLPEIGYAYDTPSEFDLECGTYGIGDSQLPNIECPQTFLCTGESDGTDSDSDLEAFEGCINAMDCAMFKGMTSTITDTMAGTDLFNYQMIPHHRNAVNMAKALLKTGVVVCESTLDTETDACIFEGLLREIINVQNFQIATMQGLLSEASQAEVSDCEVIPEISGVL